MPEWLKLLSNTKGLVRTSKLPKSILEYRPSITIPKQIPNKASIIRDLSRQYYGVKPHMNIDMIQPYEWDRIYNTMGNLKTIPREINSGLKYNDPEFIFSGDILKTLRADKSKMGNSGLDTDLLDLLKQPKTEIAKPFDLSDLKLDINNNIIRVSSNRNSQGPTDPPPPPAGVPLRKFEPLPDKLEKPIPLFNLEKH